VPQTGVRNVTVAWAEASLRFVVLFRSRLSRALVFPSARAIRQPALELWQGEEGRILAAQQAWFRDPDVTRRRAVANTRPR
jgi:hypothetical protein